MVERTTHCDPHKAINNIMPWRLWVALFRLEEFDFHPLRSRVPANVRQCLGNVSDQELNIDLLASGAQSLHHAPLITGAQLLYIPCVAN